MLAMQNRLIEDMGILQVVPIDPLMNSLHISPLAAVYGCPHE